MDEERFEGHSDRECGEHRTVGYRAWCFDCSEWCYPKAPCVRCQVPALRNAIARAKIALVLMRHGIENGPRTERAKGTEDACDVIEDALVIDVRSRHG